VLVTKFGVEAGCVAVCCVEALEVVVGVLLDEDEEDVKPNVVWTNWGEGCKLYGVDVCTLIGCGVVDDRAVLVIGLFVLV
jgi:hypothetical protein